MLNLPAFASILTDFCQTQPACNRASQWSRASWWTIVFAFSSRRLDGQLSDTFQTRFQVCGDFGNSWKAVSPHVLLHLQGMSCYRERRKGCRKRKSVRGNTAWDSGSTRMSVSCYFRHPWKTFLTLDIFFRLCALKFDLLLESCSSAGCIVGPDLAVIHLAA